MIPWTQAGVRRGHHRCDSDRRVCSERNWRMVGGSVMTQLLGVGATVAYSGDDLCDSEGD